VDGLYRNWDAVNARFRGTRTRVVSVTVFGQPGAHVIDCESGNVTPDQAALWAYGELRSRRRPTLYGSRDTRDAFITQLNRYHVHFTAVDYWLPDYTQVATNLAELRWPRRVPADFSAWQFAGSIPVAGGHSIDASIVNANWAIARGLASRGVTVTFARRGC
jgi:hypothetical protein